jgi:signal transduction histidine kinase
VLLGLCLGIAVYSVGAHTRPGVPTAGGLALVGALVALGALSEDQSDFGDVVFFSVVFGGVWLAGRAIRRRRLREAELVVERDTSALAAVAEERARIARELHDVVAHAVSVIVLQARGGRRILDEDPDEARGAFDTIEETGTRALVEMRRLLGLLRADDEALALAPQPSLGELDRLAAQVREAGLPVEVAIEGEPVELPPGVDVSAYRIVQEALTNALRHAGPARARVLVRYGADELELEITDDGPGIANGAGAGHGLVGIRERVAVYGGELTAGSRVEGGYALRARLPLAGR